MNLEDHLGDILRKARQAADIPAARAAQTAGLSEEEWSALEESGRVSKRLDFSALAALLGLNANKLEGIANGWLPKAQDLSLWRELRLITTTREGITANCYLIWDEVSREGALFDTGWEAE